MSSSSRAKAEKTRKRNTLPASTAEDWETGQPTDSRAILLARYSVHTLSWLVVVVLAAFFAVQCDRYIALRRYEAPPPIDVPSKNELDVALERVSDTYRVDEMITELEALSDTLADAVPAPMRLDGVDVYPADSICLREGFGDAEAGDWATFPPSNSGLNATFEFNGEHYRFRSTGHLTFARDVRVYMVDTGHDSDVRADLHVVAGDVQYATVDVSAFYNDAGALDTIDACTYRVDGALEPGIDDGDWLPDAPLRINLFRLQSRANALDKGSDVRYNVTFTIPAVTRDLYSLKLGSYNITLHDGLTLDELDVQTSGNVHAERGFKAIRLGVRTHGVQGSVSGHFDVMNGDVDVYTDGAPIDMRIDVTRTPTKNGKTPTQKINLEAINAKFDVQLLLEDQADDCDPAFHPASNCAWVQPFAFDIRATSSNYPHRVTILDGSSYPAGARILARATNAPATLKLDSSFEGTYNLITGKRALDAGKTFEVSIVDPSGRGRERIFVEGLASRHAFSGAVGWGSKDAATQGASYAEVEVDEGMHMAHVDISPSNFWRVG